MLHELRVENLLLIERAELRFGGGLNVLTGETGAGKTVLAHALDLLLGGRPRSGIVRPGASEAYVEGVFELQPAALAVASPEVREQLEGQDEITLARRVTSEGRTRAYINGRSATVGELGHLAGSMLAFFGQHEQRKLTVASAQLEILDGFAGTPHLEQRAKAAEIYSQLTKARKLFDELQQDAGAAERELDLLRFELDEIDAVDPNTAEFEQLTASRTKLRQIEQLRAAAASGYEAIESEDGPGAGAADRLASAGAQLEQLQDADPEFQRLAERMRSLEVEARDLATDLHAYQRELDADGEQLVQVEERVEQYERLLRKHGGSVESVVAHADAARERIAVLSDGENSSEVLEEQVQDLEQQLEKLAAGLTKTRKGVAPKLETAVAARLGELAMPDAEFQIQITPLERPVGTGGDRIDFLLRANAGVDAGPLREIASGGEISRVMLALLSVAASGDGATLVFDEIDAGVGGKTANAVGDQLARLGESRQLITITHLPQVAARAQSHFRIAKLSDGELAVATVAALDKEAVLGEIVRMLGADDGDVAARKHAKSLLQAA